MPARHQPPPTLRLRRLAAELRRLRAAAGLTRDEVTERTRINEATLYRIETGRARPQVRTLMALLGLYAVSEHERDELLALSRQSSQQSWLQSFPGLPDPYTTYITFEAEAQSLLNYEALFIPGLLQTEAYARAALQRGLPSATKEEIERLVEARMSRQAVLTRSPALKLWAIVDEAALHRKVGGPEVMNAQLEHLAESATEFSAVTVQVVPYDAGGHPGMAGAFAILQFGEPSAHDVVYIESQAADLFLESQLDVDRFTAIFQHLHAQALAPKASVSFIRRIASEQKGEMRKDERPVRSPVAKEQL